MKVVDLNLLLYAVNADAPQHRKAVRWWESAVNGDEQVGLAWVVLLGFLRLVTRGGVLPRPLTVEEACQVVDEWIEHPSIVVLHPGDGHWAALQRLLKSVGVGGNLTTDAHLAALALEYDATLYSADADMSRYAPVRVLNPLA